MSLRFNEVTWYSRWLSIIFIFGLFPMLVFYIGSEYQKTIDVLSYGHVAAYELHATGTYEQNASVSKQSVNAEFNIEGDWQSKQDEQYIFRVKDNNSFYELYKGSVVASGSWILRDTLAGTEYADLESALYLEKKSLDNQGAAEKMYFKVLYLDKDKLSLSHLGRGNTLEFTKKSTVPTDQKLR